MPFQPELHHRLQQLTGAWFVPTIGWAGLGMAWLRAQALLGDTALLAAHLAAWLACAAFALVLLAQLIRGVYHPHALASDFRHPITHAFVAACPIAMILMATVSHALYGQQAFFAPTLWWLGALLEFAATVWVASRWIKGLPAGGASWPDLTPVLFIPIVGNVITPLGGLPMGFDVWAAAQFAVGAFLWPLLLVLILVRVLQAGPLPGPMSPAWLIVVAPPSVVGVGLHLFQAPVLLSWGCWGLALFHLLWALTQWRVVHAQPFGMAHWGMSFPLAAFSALSLLLAHTDQGGWLQVPALAVLLLTTLTLLALTGATLHGLAKGTLLGAPPAN